METYEKIISNVLKQFSNLDHDTKEDLRQELRMYVFENENKFKENAYDIAAYVFISLKRKTINLLKSSKYRKIVFTNSSYLSDSDASNQNSYDGSISQNETEIMMFIDREFSKKDQNIFKAYFYENKTYKQIGRKYGVSADAMRRKIQKMLEQIRRWWK